MSYDGTLKFNTAIDAKGFQNGINSIAGMAEKGLKATTAIITGASAAIGTMATAAIKAGSDFEGAMSKVEAISGATGSDLEALTNKAKEMGASTKFSATESANAFEYMAMAGWKTTDMLNGIEGIMNLAAASGEDLATTSDIVTDALTAFGLSAQDSTHFADILAQASSNANTNVGMMGETFKYVAPVAGALGYSAEDTATAIGLMANAGIKGSQAGTALRSIMSRLAKPTDEVQSAMDALGISLTDEQGKMKSLNEIMADLRDGFSDLSEAEAAQMAASLGGQEAMSGLLAIVNSSDTDFEKLQSSIYSCDDAAARMAETMNDNLQGQLTILKSGLEGLGISFYESVQAPLKDIAVEAQGMVQQLQEAFDAGGLDGIVTAFGDILAQTVKRIASAAPELINTATKLVCSFCDSLKNNPEIGEAAASLISSLVTAILSCSEDIWTTAIVLVENMAQGLASELPTILQQGIDLVLELGKGMADALPELVPIVVECLLDLVDAFFSNIDSIIEVGFQIIMALAEGIIKAVPILLQKIPEIFRNIFLEMARSSTENLEILKETISSKVSEIIESVSNWFSQLPEIIGIWLTDTADRVQQWGIDLLVTAAIAAQNAVNKISEWFQQLPRKVLIWLTNTILKVMQFAADLKVKADTAARGFVTNLVNGVKELPNRFREIGSNIVNGIWEGISSGWNWLTDKVKALANSLFKAAKAALGTNSPSRVFAREVGRWIPPGIGVGIEDAMPDLESQVGNEMSRIALKMQAAVEVETGKITVNTKSKAQHTADTEYPVSGGDTYIDEHIEQENNYHVPVATPSATSKAGREAVRKLLGGVK